jgi:Family of unknown function (DUF5946)
VAADPAPTTETTGTPTTETCPGCGTVLAAVPGRLPGAGASASCTRLFEVTLRGLREEPDAAAVVRLADAAYAAQHPPPEDPGAACAAAARLAAALDAPPPDDGATPLVWRSTIADVAADLDVIDLPVLVETWARSVHDDWATRVTQR